MTTLIMAELALTCSFNSRAVNASEKSPQKTIRGLDKRALKSVIQLRRSTL